MSEGAAGAPQAQTACSSVNQDINRVEIKMNVSSEQALYAARTLHLDLDKAQFRKIFFFDTAELDHFGRGLILRGRLIKDAEDDSTIKIRPVEPESISDEWRSQPGFKMESDLVGGKAIRSASLTDFKKPGEVQEMSTGQRLTAKLFSADQERFLQQHGHASLDFAPLKIMGPVEVFRWKIKRPPFPYELTAEEWRLPNTTDLVELSIKVLSADEERALTLFADFLHGLKLETGGEQQTKTKVILQYFAGYV